MKFFLQHYFPERNYALIYAHKGLQRLANVAKYTFTGAYFLELGMPLHFVLLFFGLEFGLRGFLCPYGMAIINRFGVVKALTLVAIFKTIFFLLMSLAPNNLWLGFSSLIFFAMSGGIYYSLYDIMEAIYIKDHYRGRQYTFGIVTEALMAIVGVAAFGYLLSEYSYFVAALPSIVALFLSVLPFLVLQKEITKIKNYKPHKVYPFLISEFKPYLLTFFGLQLMIIASSVAAPIFIYLVVGEIQMLSLLIAAAIGVELVLTLVFGHYIDSKGTAKSLKPAVMMNWLVMLGFMFVAKTPLKVFLIETGHKMAYNFLRSCIVTGFHRKSRDGKSHLLMYGLGMQMTLCLFELATLPFYALAAVWMEESVFYLIFAGSMLGAYLSARLFWK